MTLRVLFCDPYSTVAPLWVRILNTRSSLSAGRPYDIICRSAGARPPAEITWRLDRSKITSHIAKVRCSCKCIKGKFTSEWGYSLTLII